MLRPQSWEGREVDGGDAFNYELNRISAILFLNEWSTSVAPLTYLHLEVVEGVLVDVLHLVHQPHGVVGQGPDVRAAHLVVRGVVEARGRHVGGADGLDLLQLSELVLADDLRIGFFGAFTHLAANGSMGEMLNSSKTPLKFTSLCFRTSNRGFLRTAANRWQDMLITGKSQTVLG